MTLGWKAHHLHLLKKKKKVIELGKGAGSTKPIRAEITPADAGFDKIVLSPVILCKYVVGGRKESTHEGCR